MGTNQDYKNRAIASLTGNWGTAAIATLIYIAITGSVNVATSSYVIGAGSSISSIWTLLCLPLGWGFSVYFLNLIRQESIAYERLFDGYKDFVRTFLLYFLYSLAVVIGMLLFIIPGIILAIGLMMSPYIVKDDKEISAMDALKKSWEITKGHKMKLFWLGLSFIGWGLLCILTLGIGFLFLAPYMNTAFAHYYEDLKNL